MMIYYFLFLLKSLRFPDIIHLFNLSLVCKRTASLPFFLFVNQIFSHKNSNVLRSIFFPLQSINNVRIFYRIETNRELFHTTCPFTACFSLRFRRHRLFLFISYSNKHVIVNDSIETTKATILLDIFPPFIFIILYACLYVNSDFLSCLINSFIMQYKRAVFTARYVSI